MKKNKNKDILLVGGATVVSLFVIWLVAFSGLFVIFQDSYVRLEITAINPDTFTVAGTKISGNKDIRIFDRQKLSSLYSKFQQPHQYLGTIESDCEVILKSNTGQDRTFIFYPQHIKIHTPMPQKMTVCYPQDNNNAWIPNPPDILRHTKISDTKYDVVYVKYLFGVPIGESGSRCDILPAVPGYEKNWGTQNRLYYDSTGEFYIGLISHGGGTYAKIFIGFSEEYTNIYPRDTDGDGIIDDDDSCPLEPGPIENNGCPLPQPPNPLQWLIDFFTNIIAWIGDFF